MTIKRSSWSIPYLIFLLIFVVLPLVLIAIYAFQDGEGGFTFANIARFFTDQDSLSTFALSLEVAIENTAICLLLGYPAAWILANKDLNRSAVTVILFILPMWINALMRTLATAELFNVFGVTLGKGTLLFGMAYDYLPFMIYPIYNTLNKMDKSYTEAAQDLGATPGQVFRKVTLPLSMPGVTSGIMMVAKNDETQTELSRMLKDREIEKHYLALTEGIMKEKEGTIEAPIGRSKRDRKKMAVDPEGRPAVTEWRVIAEGRNCSLLDVHILTGRTHQIRVHMRNIQHPVCGDPLYGYEKGLKVPCLMLHARSLSFAHPRTREKMTFQAPLPGDFLKGLKMNGMETDGIQNV